jgi:hypothetical protein
MHMNFYLGDSAPCEIAKGSLNLCSELCFITVFYCSFFVGIITVFVLLPRKTVFWFSGHYFILLCVFIVFNTKKLCFYLLFLYPLSY